MQTIRSGQVILSQATVSKQQLNHTVLYNTNSLSSNRDDVIIAMPLWHNDVVNVVQ